MKRFIIGTSIACAALTIYAFSGATSGLNVGEMVTPFHPTHITGPDKGTDTCPPCKYGSRPAVQVWVNNDTAENVATIAKTLSAEVGNSSADLKGFVIKLTMCQGCESAAKTMAGKAPTNIGFAMIDNKNEAIKNYKVNVSDEVKNTIFVYKNKKVVAKFVNLVANEKGIAELQAAITKAEAN